MAKVSIDKNDDRKWAFTTNPNDIRANLFTRAQEKSYGKQLTKDELIFQIMCADNYEEASKRGEQYNDVHHEFTDFIIESAYFHRLLDEPNKQITMVNSTVTNVPANPQFIANANVPQAQNAQVIPQYFKTAAQPVQVMDAGARATVANSAIVATVYEHVYANWNNLSTESQKFYNEYFMLMVEDNGSWSYVRDPASFSGADARRIRINLKKSFDGIHTNFAAMLPDFPTALLKNVFYTDASGNVTSFGGADANFFRNLYDCIYKGTVCAGVSLPVDYATASRNKPTYFSIKVDDLIRKRMFAASAKNIGAVNFPGTDEFVDMLDANIWKQDASGNFYKEIDGKKILFGMDSPDTKMILKANHNCYSSLYKGAQGTQDECRDYMYNCLLNSDENALEKCITRLKMENFDKVTKDEINGIHPVIALRTLQKLGFRKYKADDLTCGMKLFKIECVNSWLENMKTSNLNTTVVQNIVTGNVMLIKYLNLLAQFVNANPGILNKDYNGPTDEKTGRFVQSNRATQLGIKSRMEVPKNNLHKYEMANFRFKATIADQLLQMTKNNNKTTATFMPQFGGHGGVLSHNFKLNFNAKTEEFGKFKGALLNKEIFDEMIDNLERKGKTLNKADKDEIYTQLKKHHAIEESLGKILSTMREYDSLISAFRDYTAETISFTTLNKLEERYQKLLSAYNNNENYFVKVLSLMDVDDKDYQPIA